MPKILDRLVQQLMDKGASRYKAYAIAVSALQKTGNLKPGTLEPTKKGIVRGNMTPEERAKDRAIMKHGGRPSDYSYDYKTNRTRKK